MEFDSQIPDDKTLENKSISPFNFVYKKIIIKEKQGNLKPQL